MNGNRKLFWKEVSKLNGGIVESCSRIKEINNKGIINKGILRGKD